MLLKLCDRVSKIFPLLSFSTRTTIYDVHVPLSFSFLFFLFVLFSLSAAPWRAWQSVLSTLVAATQSPDTDTLFTPTPQLRAQLVQLQTTLLQQVNKPALLLKPLGPALRTNTTQKRLLSNIQMHPFLSQSAPRTGAHLLQPNSEAYEAEDRCFRVSAARRLMLPHPAAPDPSGVVLACTTKSAACACRCGSGVDRRHAAVASCLADVIHTTAPRCTLNSPSQTSLVW